MGRLFVTRSYEFRTTEFEADGLTLEGYAAVFDQPAEIRSASEGFFTESVKRGAFAKTLREHTPVMQFDHGRDPRVGSVPIGAFQEIREDSHGLYVRARLHQNPVVEPVRQAIESGALTGMSIRMAVIQDLWTGRSGDRVSPESVARMLNRPDNGLHRSVREIALREAGPVVFPAYAGTAVGVRDDDDERPAVTTDLARRRLELLRAQYNW